MGSDAAAEEYRQAQSSREEKIEYEENKREEKIIADKVRSDGIRGMLNGSMLVLTGAAICMWHIVKEKRRAQMNGCSR